MIFVALGTERRAFDRALDQVSEARLGQPTVVQHGATPPRPSWTDATWHEMVAYAEMVRLVRAADVVVTHGGTGSIITCLSQGVRPIVIPRLKKYGEHVDDHQLQITEELVRAGLVTACASPGELRGALEVHDPVARWSVTNSLAAAVVEACGVAS